MIDTAVSARSATLALRGGVHVTFQHVYRCDLVSSVASLKHSGPQAFIRSLYNRVELGRFPLVLAMVELRWF